MKAFGNKFSLSTMILTLVLFIGGLQFESYGQTESPFADCIMIIDKTLQVLLSTDEDCSEQQFTEAVNYYKANGFPHEGSYSDLFGVKTMQLLTNYGQSLESDMSK
jgi:hypothetical protein